LAVLEAKCKTSFANKDVFLTVLGGMRIHEPAADLCVALALLSCLKKRPLSPKTVAFGEIGLTGEIYNASFTEHRLREAHNLGFEHIFMPPHRGDYTCPDLDITHVRHVNDLERCFE
jgi:DNA repair protein RadA/Sms